MTIRQGRIVSNLFEFFGRVAHGDGIIRDILCHDGGGPHDRIFQFYRELMGSHCLTLMYDIFEAHTGRDASDTHTDRTASIVRQLMDLLSTGINRTERDVSYYADRLNVSPKYLGATVKRITGLSVTSYINRHTVPILKKYLEDDRLSLTQISEMMSFTSLSYFSRYCSKHLGQSPSAYRLSLQPREKQ